MSGRSGKAITDFMTGPTMAGFISMVEGIDRTLKQRLLGYKHFDQMRHAAEILIKGMPEVVYARLTDTPPDTPIEKRRLHMSMMFTTTAIGDQDFHGLAQMDYSIEQGSAVFAQRGYPLYIIAPHVFTRYISRQRAPDAQPLHYLSEDFEILCGVSLVMSFARMMLIAQNKVPVAHAPGCMPFRNGLLLGDMMMLGEQAAEPFGSVVYHTPQKGKDGIPGQQFVIRSEFTPRVGLMMKTFIEKGDFLGRQGELYREMTDLFAAPDTVKVLKKANRVFIERSDFTPMESTRFNTLIAQMADIMMGPNWGEHDMKRGFKKDLH